MFQVGVPVSVPSGSVDRPANPAPVLEEDDLNATVPPGTVCRRKGCGVTFISDEVNRQGDGEGAVCHYHPLPVSNRILPLLSKVTDCSRSLERAARSVHSSIFMLHYSKTCFSGLFVLQTQSPRVRRVSKD